MIYITEPCWVVQCDECQERFQQEDITTHFTSEQEAEAWVKECDWVQILDGTWRCDSCNEGEVDDGCPICTGGTGSPCTDHFL